MLLLVVTSLAVTLSSAYKCCGPTQWEGTVRIQMGSYVNETDQHFTSGDIQMSFDGVNRIIAQSQNLIRDGTPLQQRLVFDYKQGLVNIINSNGNCYRVPTEPWFGNCIPDNATSGDIYFGGLLPNTPKVQAKSYNINMGTYQIYITVTSDTCIPMTEGVAGTMGNEQVMQEFIFLNVTGSISDRSVFIVPDACEHAVIGPRIPALGKRSVFM